MLGRGHIKGRACHSMDAKEEDRWQGWQVEHELHAGQEVQLSINVGREMEQTSKKDKLAGFGVL